MNKTKIFNIKQIQGACVLGSPIVAGILIAYNFKKFGNRQMSVLWIFIGFVWTLVLIGLGILLPDQISKSAGMVIPFINGALIYPIIKKQQGELIGKHFENDGDKGSNWIIGGMIVSIVALFLVPIIYLNNLSQLENYNRQAFGTNGIYFNKEISLEEVNKLGGILKRVEYFNPESVAEVIFLSNDSTYELKLIIDKSASNDTIFNIYVKELFNHINSYRFRKPLKFIITDIYLKNDKIIVLDENVEYASLVEIEVFSGNTNFRLLYNKSIEKTEREKFQKLILEMNNIFPPQNESNFLVDYEHGAYSLRLFIPKQQWTNPRLLSDAKYFKEKLNNYGFDHPFKLILVDNSTNDIEEREM
ncbi:hypothetical protein [uncultured Draconibacterium sp.]|uniref:hypothetical protein n=1 Tax=uncultured Draconibacterium sp. TaxID=1573823 RepID=UPI003217F521